MNDYRPMRHPRSTSDRGGARAPAALPCLLGALLLALVAFPVPAAEGDYEAGKRAYLAGDYERALAIWQPLAESGDRFAQFSLGSLYFEGSGVEKDLEESARWFRAAAEQGYAPAQFNLGNAYKHGNGVPQDDLEAAEWWRKAAEQNFAPAQFNLGTQYYFGRGVPKDEQIAIAWYRRAAENGHAQAQRLFSVSEGQGGVTMPESGAPPEPSTATAATASTAAASGAASTAASTTTAGVSAAAASAATPAASGVATRDPEWLLAQNPDHYTLQLIATQSEELMREYLDKHRFREHVTYFGFDRDGKRWYAAVYGAYAGKSQAQAAVATLPGDVRRQPPWIRQFGGIQKIMLKN